LARRSRCNCTSDTKAYSGRTDFDIDDVDNGDDDDNDDDDDDDRDGNDDDDDTTTTTTHPIHTAYCSGSSMTMFSYLGAGGAKDESEADCSHTAAGVTGAARQHPGTTMLHESASH
jgi:hypothetical protein